MSLKKHEGKHSGDIPSIKTGKIECAMSELVFVYRLPLETMVEAGFFSLPQIVVPPVRIFRIAFQLSNAIVQFFLHAGRRLYLG